MGYLLHHSIQAAAQQAPDHEAFRFEGTALTYGALDRQANQLAHLLLDAGVQPQNRVGIYMTKGLELPVALYGILKAGAAYVPIDPSAPVDRVRFMLKDCGIRHLITNGARRRQTGDLVQDSGVRCVVGMAAPPQAASGEVNFYTWEDLGSAKSRPPDVRVIEQDLAYIMYTSGSTGAPKGLMHTHHSGLSYARYSARTYGVGPEDRLGNHSPLHFDMSTFEFLTAPLCGATTVIIPEEVMVFPVSLAQLIEAERLTLWYSVPLALIQMLTHGGLEQRQVSSLRWVIFGGEPFPTKYLWRLMDLWPQARFSNSYGPAEVNQCTYYHVPVQDKGSDAAVPLGRIWDGAQELIVDPDDQEVAPGQVGELLVRSATMMRGYWARPDLNEKSFYVRQAFPNFDQVFYRTGDLVRQRDDGQLMFLGRKDRQIKLRGYRVELDEVEKVVGACDSVAEAAVVALRDGEEKLEIIAALILHSDATADLEQIRRQTAAKLPAYAVPTRFDLRTVFPRTTSGKISRKQLAEEYQNERQP